MRRDVPVLRAETMARYENPYQTYRESIDSEAATSILASIIARATDARSVNGEPIATHLAEEQAAAHSVLDPHTAGRNQYK